MRRFWSSKPVRLTAGIGSLQVALAALTGCVTNPAVKDFGPKFMAIKPGNTREQVHSLLQGARDSATEAVLLDGTDETWWFGSVEPPNASLDVTYDQAGRVVKVRRHSGQGSPIGACVVGCEAIPSHSELTIIRLANAAALEAGHNLSDYDKPHAVYRLFPEGHEWFVYYYNSKVINPDGTFNGFIAAVDDRTGVVRLIP